MTWSCQRLRLMGPHDPAPQDELVHPAAGNQALGNWLQVLPDGVLRLKSDQVRRGRSRSRPGHAR